MDNNFIKLHRFIFTIPTEDVEEDSIIISHGIVKDIFVNKKDIIYFCKDDRYPFTLLSLHGLNSMWVTEDVDHIFKVLNNYITLESGGHEL